MVMLNLPRKVFDVFRSYNVMKMKLSYFLLIIVSNFLATAPAFSAIALDRTRGIYPGSEKSIGFNIANENKEKPYLAQAWIEDSNGKKSTRYFSLMPELQRVEPGNKSTIRINAMPSVDTLPQDRESLFYFNIREIPPKSDRPNTVQLALQTKIKLFYRPKSIIPEKYSRQDDKLILHIKQNGYEVENPTPYYMTVLGIAGGKAPNLLKNSKPVMLAPFSKALFKSERFATPYITTINDFGGKPALQFICNSDLCKAKTEDKI